MNTLLLVADYIPPYTGKLAHKALTVTLADKAAAVTLTGKVAENLTTIFLLSFVVAGLASLMMWLAYRSIRSEKWVKYFAVTFGAISLNFLFKVLLPAAHINPFIDIVSQHALSILSNIFGVEAALVILDRKSLFPANLRNLIAIRNLKKWDDLLPLLCWVLAALSAVAIVIEYRLHVNGFKESLHPWIQGLVESPDSIFSALCVFLMGYAIFANQGVRRFRWWARLALFIALSYAVIRIVFGLGMLLSHLLNIDLDSLRGTMILIALPVQFGLFAFAYLLVVRFSELLSGVRRRQEDDSYGQEDYLSSDGIVRLISEKLSTVQFDGEHNPNIKTAQKRGFVNLVIRLPGEQNKKVACILWPNESVDKTMKVLDWLAPTEFSHTSADYKRENTTEVLQWRKYLKYIGQVLTEENSKELILPKDFRGQQTEDGPNKSEMGAIVTVVIRARGAAIGCLQVALSEHNFSQLAVRQIREIAHLISPSVQAYRELGGLDQMSIRFAEKQAEEKNYSPQEATQLIAGILHDIFSPTVTYLHMNSGFYTTQTIYKTEKDMGRVKEKIEKETLGKKWEEFPETITSLAYPTPFKLLKKQLTARATQTSSTIPAYTYTEDRFSLGNLILAVPMNRDSYNHPTLGATYLYRKTASTLAANAYLEFTRDYYSSILKTLGRELSAKRLDIDEWFEPIQKILTGQAGFTWVVIRQRGQRGFGDKEGLAALQSIRSLKHQVVTRRFNYQHSPEIKTHYKLNNPQFNCHHILKLRLASSEGFVWLGVGRAGFGPELDFSSPWKNFLVNFAQIADASLSRITFPEKFQLQLEAAQLQGIISAIATTGTMVHQLSNMIAGQSSSNAVLLEALKLGKLKAEDKSLERIISAMSDGAERMQDIFKSFTHLRKIDEHSPCQLIEAAVHASNLFELSLLQRQIRLDIDINESIFVDVPFNVAALALANLVGNAKDAVDKGGRILIESAQDGDFVLCRVSDNGRGIAPGLRDKIFNSNFTTKETGTGLGLYLTYQSLRENRSSVELTKTDETGSVFTVRFPLSRNEAKT